ncbi:MAG: VCBS repeat-containing protein [Pyrinomonadaceae bacterium]|nr:VCBS repeat-containing protein [Pyrinomonadaceae bacterium]
MRKLFPRRNQHLPVTYRMTATILSLFAAAYLALSPLALNNKVLAAPQDGDAPAVPEAIIYDNGPLATGATSRSGVAAPAGTQWSEATNPLGNTQQANTTAGVSCSVTATVFRCADDFNVPVGQTWTINQVIVFAYQTGFAGATSPITAATLRIWNGRPGDAGSTIIFGDTTTNRLATSTDSGLWRIFNTVVGSGANPPTAAVTNRRVWQNNINVAPAAVLTAGNYWIDWNTAIGTAAHFAPSVTILNQRGVPGWNARQNTGAAWVNSVDIGQFPTGAPTPQSLPQDFPFKLDGSVAGAPNVTASRRVDFNGDNKSDLAVARATGAAAQTTWYIQNSGGTSTATNWGLGVGFSGGDVATPEDFDGDGKTDIAVWRSHPTAANFYILQSNGNTLRTEQFGKVGDDPTVIDDYDGDGKADVAVFRSTADPGDPCGGASVWYWRPSGTPATNFSYSCWGAAGDKAYPGDFDGDGRADPSVVRNSGGSGIVLQNRTTAGSRTVFFGNFTDRYLAGDYDADGRQDLASARVNGASLTMYFTNSGNGQTFIWDLGSGATDMNVPGDYDGDNKTDFAIWRSGAGADNGTFYIVNTFTSPVFFKFGSSSANLAAPDYPVAAYQAH